MSEYNYKIENQKLKVMIKSLKQELADYHNRYKQLSGSKRELRIENKFIREEYNRLFAEYMDVVVLHESLVDRFEDLSQSLINDEQKRIIRQELNFLKERRSLVSSTSLEINQEPQGNKDDIK